MAEWWERGNCVNGCVQGQFATPGNLVDSLYFQEVVPSPLLFPELADEIVFGNVFETVCQAQQFFFPLQVQALSQFSSNYRYHMKLAHLDLIFCKDCTQLL